MVSDVDKTAISAASLDIRPCLDNPFYADGNIALFNNKHET